MWTAISFYVSHGWLWLSTLLFYAVDSLPALPQEGLTPLLLLACFFSLMVYGHRLLVTVDSELLGLDQIQDEEDSLCYSIGESSVGSVVDSDLLGLDILLEEDAVGESEDAFSLSFMGDDEDESVFEEEPVVVQPPRRCARELKALGVLPNPSGQSMGSVMVAGRRRSARLQSLGM